MKDDSDRNEEGTVDLVDFGDVMAETKQCSPIYPIWWDSIYGLGNEPWPTPNC